MSPFTLDETSMSNWKVHPCYLTSSERTQNSIFNTILDLQLSHLQTQLEKLCKINADLFLMKFLNRQLSSLQFRWKTISMGQKQLQEKLN